MSEPDAEAMPMIPSALDTTPLGVSTGFNTMILKNGAGAKWVRVLDGTPGVLYTIRALKGAVAFAVTSEQFIPVPPDEMVATGSSYLYFVLPEGEETTLRCRAAVPGSSPVRFASANAAGQGDSIVTYSIAML
jgi:hypothetical protein